MLESTPVFEWYDAWILCALLTALEGDEPVPLWRLIGAADGVNKAIISRDELEVGIGRLIAADYVRAGADGFEVTLKGLELRPLTGGYCTERIGKAIGAGEWAPGLEMPRTTTETYVTHDAYKRAVKKYHREFWRAYKKS